MDKIKILKIILDKINELVKIKKGGPGSGRRPSGNFSETWGRMIRRARGRKWAPRDKTERIKRPGQMTNMTQPRRIGREFTKPPRYIGR